MQTTDPTPTRKAQPTAGVARSPVGPRQLADIFTGTRLTPAQRRIAAHIVQSGPQAAVLSSVELAEQVGVSQPSVTRLATALGYNGFTELQQALRAMILESPGPELADASDHANAHADTTGDQTRRKLTQAIDHTIDGLRVLQRSLSDPTNLNAAAAELVSSPVLPVYGARSAQPLAAQFTFFAAKIHPDVRQLEGSVSQVNDQLTTAARLGATTILAFALPRYPRELLAVLGIAHALDLRVVLLTDSPFTPLTELADHLLIAPVASDLVFDSPVAPLQLLTVLLEAIADASPDRTRRRLDEFERTAARGDYFLED